MQEKCEEMQEEGKEMKRELGVLYEELDNLEAKIEEMEEKEKLTEKETLIKEQNDQIDKQDQRIKEQNGLIKEQNKLIKEIKNKFEKAEIEQKMSRQNLKVSSLTKQIDQIDLSSRHLRIKKILNSFLKNSKKSLNNRTPLNELLNKTRTNAMLCDFNEASIPIVNRTQEINEIVDGITSDFLKINLGKKIQT
ncbi:zinc finger protein [Anaeramoeba flamelloides]|uniref:Zinc finger protein n=1 Tax=Anaeramoeba flamelloides TaxID=1746091 RepID=A0AAV7YNU7_9EUKA|nr:zinc finger protein [Anaeramoeba flamelloides]